MAQPAYTYEPQPQRRVREVERPPLRALPGKGLAPKTKFAPAPLLKTTITTVVSCFLVVVAVGLLSVGVSNASVQLLLETETVSASITDARAEGLQLEVQHSIATNPARIQEAASALGLVPDTQIQTIEAADTISPDVLGAIPPRVASVPEEDAATDEAVETVEAEPVEAPIEAIEY